MNTVTETANELRPQEAIHTALCTRILNGTLAPGAQLPTVVALKEEFGVAVLTMQRALERMKNDGITRAVRGKGTFVNTEAPCLKRIGLVFPSQRGAADWSLLFEALLLAAEKQAADQGLQIATYFGQGAVRDEDEHARLIDDIKWCRLAGILFAVHPFNLNGTPAMAPSLPIPRVAIMSGLGYPDICAIYPDQHSFCQNAAQALLRGNCRSCACIATINWPKEKIEDLKTRLHENGIALPDRWTQAVPHQEPHWARNCAHQLFCSDHNEIPDSLVITDDHLVEATLAGLHDAGQVPGKDVQVIAYRNHPSPHPMAEGVTYLGADLCQLFCQALETMNHKRKGLPFSQATSLPATFQDIPHASQQ